MQQPFHRAILMVSFGTAVMETRTKTLDMIEQTAAETFPDHAHYRAWTSPFLRKKVLNQENLRVDSVSEALNRMHQDGIQDVLIQPTFVTDSTEYEKLIAEASAFSDVFRSLRFGLPLLYKDMDPAPVADALREDLAAIGSGKWTVFMGHGIPGTDDYVYSKINLALKNAGFPQVRLISMKSPEALETLIADARAGGVTDLVLTPFMIVSGHHVIEDMAGNRETSWKSRLESAGFSVRCILKGLGENPKIRSIFLDRIRNSLS